MSWRSSRWRPSSNSTAGALRPNGSTPSGRRRPRRRRRWSWRTRAAKKALDALGEAPAGHLLKRLTAAGREQEDIRKNALAKADLAQRDAKAALERVKRLDEHAAQARREADRSQARLAVLLTRLTARADAAQDAADGATAFVVPDEAWEGDQARRDLRAPWSDETWNRARTACFLAALDLHEATLLANGRDARRNLAVAIDLLTGRVTGLTHEVVPRGVADAVPAGARGEHHLRVTADDALRHRPGGPRLAADRRGRPGRTAAGGRGDLAVQAGGDRRRPAAARAGVRPAGVARRRDPRAVRRAARLRVARGVGAAPRRRRDALGRAFAATTTSGSACR